MSDQITLPLTGPQIAARLAGTSPEAAAAAISAADQSHAQQIRALFAPTFGQVQAVPGRRAVDIFAL